MDRKKEKSLLTLGDEELSTVAGAGYEGPAGYDWTSMVKIADYSKTAYVDQHNHATNVLFGDGSLLNSQTNAAVVTQ